MEVMIGIIGAMAEEVAKLKEMMEDVKVTRKASREFYEGKLNGTEVVIVQGGVGKVNAACCTQTLIDTFPVSCVINTGIAGGLFPDINIGDVVLATDAVEHDMEADTLPGRFPAWILFLFRRMPICARWQRRAVSR